MDSFLEETERSCYSGMFVPNINGNGLCQFSGLSVGGFSYNFFVGNVPACLKYLPRSSFQGNCLQDHYFVLHRSSQIYAGRNPVSVCIPRKGTTSWKDQIPITIDGELLKNVLKFSRQELEAAYEDFSNIIWFFSRKYSI